VLEAAVGDLKTIRVVAVHDSRLGHPFLRRRPKRRKPSTRRGTASPSITHHRIARDETTQPCRKHRGHQKESRCFLAGLPRVPCRPCGCFSPHQRPPFVPKTTGARPGIRDFVFFGGGRGGSTGGTEGGVVFFHEAAVAWRSKAGSKPTAKEIRACQARCGGARNSFGSRRGVAHRVSVARRQTDPPQTDTGATYLPHNHRSRDRFGRVAYQKVPPPPPPPSIPPPRTPPMPPPPPLLLLLLLPYPVPLFVSIETS